MSCVICSLSCPHPTPHLPSGLILGALMSLLTTWPLAPAALQPISTKHLFFYTPVSLYTPAHQILWHSVKWNKKKRHGKQSWNFSMANSLLYPCVDFIKPESLQGLHFLQHCRHTQTASTTAIIHSTTRSSAMWDHTVYFSVYGTTSPNSFDNPLDEWKRNRKVHLTPM